VRMHSLRSDRVLVDRMFRIFGLLIPDVMVQETSQVVQRAIVIFGMPSCCRRIVRTRRSSLRIMKIVVLLSGRCNSALRRGRGEKET